VPLFAPNLGDATGLHINKFSDDYFVLQNQNPRSHLTHGQFCSSRFQSR